MKKIILFLFILPIQLLAQVKLKYTENLSLTYPEIVAAYGFLAAEYPGKCKMEAVGNGDNGRAIYTFVIEPYKPTNTPVTILINNGIHAGEPDGIDASIEFAQNILKGTLRYPNIRFVIIPIYNVDGNSNQSCCTRANQNGPLNQGFRGNARNLDLNRDFIKADAANTRTFYKIFQQYQPHIFIDNHVSNGADYQYTMTLITSQADKLGPVLGPFARTIMEPALYEEMAKKGQLMSPYVNTLSATPDSGIVGFLETPRFATGYAALFHCIGFVPETHMLKPFPDRVKATQQLMETIAAFASENSSVLISLKKRAIQADVKRQWFPTSWKLNENRSEKFLFKGYQAGYKSSEISGFQRLFYDRLKPFSKRINYYKHYSAIDSIAKPKTFIIPQAWHELIDRLELNGVEMSRLDKDSMINCKAFYIKSFETSPRPYEGHYLHTQTKTEQRDLLFQFFKGDYLISTNQNAVRFLMETLSPGATDSYFNWNFFDSVLQQKEYFSDYVFEDTGAELLKQDVVLKAKFESKKKTDKAFASNKDAQLNYIYTNSKYYEITHMLYPVFQLP